MKKLATLLLTLATAVSFSVPAYAADSGVSVSGFYNIEAADNVTITPMTANGSTATKSLVDFGNDSINDEFYENSVKFKVEYSTAIADAFYGVFLVEGNDVPTINSKISYIDQKTATSSTISFVVYPILPDETTDMKLYISTNADNSDLVDISLSYAANETYGIAYTLGDINNDGEYNSKDALLALQIGVGLYTPKDSERAAADVVTDGEIGSKDALKILQYSVGLIDSLN